MKKRLLIILLAGMVALTACGKDKDEQADNKAEEPKTEETTAEAEEKLVEISDEDVIGIQYSNEGTFKIPYEEEDSWDYTFSYEIPMINDESAEAKAINDEIYSFAESSIDTVEKIIAGEFTDDTFEVPSLIDIEYKAFVNDDVVSIVMQGHDAFTDWTEYYVVNFDLSTKTRIENPDLIQRAGLGIGDFTSMASGTLGNSVLETLESFLEPDEESEGEDDSWKYRMVADFIGDFASTISEENISPDMMMYLDEEGDLSVIAFVYVPAGAGRYYSDVKLVDISAGKLAESFVEYAEKYHYDGFEKECLGLFELEGYSVDITHDIEGGDEYSESVYIGFDDTDASKFLVQYAGDRYSASYSGSLKLVDINQNGLVFEYELPERDFEPISGDEEPLKGTFCLSTFDYYDETIEDVVSGCRYMFIDGDDILDTKGEIIELEKSFG